MGQISASKSSLSLQNSGIQDLSNAEELVLGVASYFAPRTVCLILVANDSNGLLGLGPLCFYIYVIMLLSIMLSELTILERDYATYMLA